jgi:hypothetical protein
METVGFTKSSSFLELLLALPNVAAVRAANEVLKLFTQCYTVCR